MEDTQGRNTRNLAQDQILCATDDEADGLYLIHSGRLMVFVTSGTVVTPLAILGPGEYFGEMSFFDHQPRSANVVAMEDTVLVKLSIDNLEKQFPSWLHLVAKSMAIKLRESSDLIRQKGIRRKNVRSIKPLSIEEQRHYYKALQDYLKRPAIPS